MYAKLFVLFAVLFAVVSAQPAECDFEPQALQLKVDESESFSKEFEPLYEEQKDSEGRALRFPRVTCDLLSFRTKIGSVEHAACAARCLAKKKKGGYCHNGVCHCRR